LERNEDLQLFVRTAALGSFSAAAREADLPPGQVSAAVLRLERQLDVRLFTRTTRSLRLTAEGEHYLPVAQEILGLLREGRERLRAGDGAISGLLQIAAPSDFGRNLLLPWLLEFRGLHDQLTLRLSLSDQVSDLFREPIDVALRYGRAEDGRYVALALAPANRRVLVAAPEYLRRRGAPATLEALRDHDCLSYVLDARPYDRWSFPDGLQRRSVTVRGPLVCDDADVVRRAAIAGAGIVYKSWLDVAEDVGAGRLVVLLGNGIGEPLPLYLICPHRKQFSPAVRALHAWLAARCTVLTDTLDPPHPASTPA
jgi:DNA-binding transcriptional LysR family regulator